MTLIDELRDRASVRELDLLAEMVMKVLRTTCFFIREAKISLLVLLLISLPRPVLAQSWKWTTETVDSNGVQPSIAVDDQGNLHISYFSSALRYAFRPAQSTKWFTMQLAPSGGYNEVFTRLVLDSAGNPSICFTPGVLKFATFQNHGWNVQQIDPQAGLIDYSCSLAVAPDGTPHVLWYQYGAPTGGFYLHVKYATLKDGVWIARTVDFEGQTGKWNSLVLDAQGNPHVSYDSFLKGELKYAYWDGKDWNRTVVDSPAISTDGNNSHGLGSSLILNRDGKAQISYETDNSLKYAWEKDGSWKLDTIENVTLTGSWIGFRTRQALDPQGNPHIVYEDGGAVKHAFWVGGKWTTQLVSAAGTRSHRYENIAIDPRGDIYIVYSDANDGSLKLSTGRVHSPAELSSAEKKP
jgi:hypothetical protein